MLIDRCLLFYLLNLCVLFKEIKLTFLLWNSNRNLSLATRHSKQRDPFVVSNWKAAALFVYLEDINRLNVQQTTQGWELKHIRPHDTDKLSQRRH
jgi:hypothetical protein